MEKFISIALTGDVMLGRGVDEAIRRFGPLYPWGNLLSELKSFGLTIVNLECVISGKGQPWSRWPKVFHFRANPRAIDTLQLAKIDCCVLANNHVLDYEEEALIEMLDLLRQAGIAYAGAGRNLDEAMRPVILEKAGAKIGVVAFTDNESGWCASETAPGTNWIEVSLEEISFKPVRVAIDSARAAGAEVVIFSIHWGPNMIERPSALFRKFAHAVMDAGADVYHGHSAHLMQGIEIYKGRPIIYDAGDFVDDYAVDPRLRNDFGVLFRLLVDRNKVVQIELIPVFISNYQVNLASGLTRKAISERISELSAEMGTLIQQEGDRLWIDCE
ncbi:MAG: CapA family protein [Acidobacteria bacterium]|nr:CapA family protein [Acidobacteriota bacterium]